jgi:hypothetical protein
MLEESIEAELPKSPFTEEIFVLTSRNAAGTILTTRTRLFDPEISRRRNLYKLIPELGRLGALQKEMIGQLEVALFSASDVQVAVTELLRRGIYCYD